MKIYLNFYVLLLEKAPASTKTLDNVELDKDTDKEYVVKEIL
jgi:hypothetical protein